MLAETTAVEPPADLREPAARRHQDRPAVAAGRLPRSPGEATRHRWGTAGSTAGHTLGRRGQDRHRRCTSPAVRRRFVRGLVAAAAVVAALGAGAAVWQPVDDDTSQARAT